MRRVVVFISMMGVLSGCPKVETGWESTHIGYWPSSAPVTGPYEKTEPGVASACGSNFTGMYALVEVATADADVLVEVAFTRQTEIAWSYATVRDSTGVTTRVTNGQSRTILQDCYVVQGYRAVLVTPTVESPPAAEPPDDGAPGGE